MGEAKRRQAMKVMEAARRKAWEAGLDEHGRIILRIAEKTAQALAIDGACYRATLFMKYHLELRYDIRGDAVVGYVNDGTDELYGYHAWLETDGLRTDVALCRPQDPSIQKRGPLTILGHEMAAGWPYTYHRTRPPQATAMIMEWMRDPSMRELVSQQEEQHMRLASTARRSDLIRVYLDGAPDGLDYERLAAMVES